VDPPYGARRLTSTVGGRNPVHSTGVGKLLLAYARPDDDAVAAWASDRMLERRTEHTRTTADELAPELRAVRARGYAVDNQENEPGIVCVAVPVFLTSPTRPSGAVSLPRLLTGLRCRVLVDQVPVILATIDRCGASR